jgi:hypothetical protein
MTSSQTATLIKHAANIRARFGSADVLAELVPLYRELSGDESFRVKPGCRGCIEDLLNYLTLTLDAYEKQQASETLRTPQRGRR